MQAITYINNGEKRPEYSPASTPPLEGCAVLSLFGVRTRRNVGLRPYGAVRALIDGQSNKRGEAATNLACSNIPPSPRQEVAVHGGVREPDGRLILSYLDLEVYLQWRQRHPGEDDVGTSSTQRAGGGRVAGGVETMEDREPVSWIITCTGLLDRYYNERFVAPQGLSLPLFVFLLRLADSREAPAAA